MKLDQLGLTPTGAAATSKLGRQVHKATVAAGKDTRLKLGVVGISIGQQQSGGLTSRINEEAATPAQTLKGLWDLLELSPPTYHDTDYDHDEAFEDAVKMLQQLRTSYSDARTALFAMRSLALDLRSTKVPDLKSNADAISSSAALQPWVVEGFNAISVVAQKAPAMKAHLSAVTDIVSTTEFVIGHILKDDESDWKPYYKIAEVALKKIGAM